MANILRELYYGNIRPDSKFYGKDSPFGRAAHVKYDCIKKLDATLSDSEKELLEKYSEVQSEIENIVRYDTFAYALRLGVLLMVDIFNNDEDGKIEL